MRNLDLDCMRKAQEVAGEFGENDASKYEKIANRALAVLAYDGPYACFLFLKQGHNKEQKNVVSEAIAGLANQSLGTEINENSPYEGIANIAENLDEYLLLKQLWERLLTYLRYHAKAEKKEV